MLGLFIYKILLLINILYSILRIFRSAKQTTENPQMSVCSSYGGMSAAGCFTPHRDKVNLMRDIDGFEKKLP